MAEGSREAIQADDEVVSGAEARELKCQVRELQRVLGKKTMESEILRDPSVSRTKKLILRLPSLPPDDTP